MSLYRVNITKGTYALVKSPVGDGARGINAMGYNVGDNFLYGALGTGTNTNLIRIAASGDSKILASPNVTFSLNSGDVDENSQYWATVSGNQWIQVDLKPRSATFGADGSDRDGEPDIRAVRLGVLRTCNGSTGLRTWTGFTIFGNIAGNNQWGAVYASDDGFLFGSENKGGEIWRFPLPVKGTAAVKISNGAPASSNDGARCIKAANV
ncbi:hypothetical protein PG994_002054 [Apiospora phragmitis]|uniref:DUF6923 domain-containing protein n=1 Tax=Apiospora phragmitis TaxID=2905665 RepID=A0ABR1WVB0_9PEZI